MKSLPTWINAGLTAAGRLRERYSSLTQAISEDGKLMITLASVKAELYKKGAIYAAMSGSGSAFFGIFTTD